jgi:tetratricopeptide (TPR) repeat protein
VRIACAAVVLAWGVLGGILWGHAPLLLAQGHGGAEGQWTLAEQFFRAGEYYRAVTEYKRFLFYFPEDPRCQDACMRIVEAHVRGEWWAQGRRAALDLLGRGVQGENRARALYLSGLCELRLGLLGEARSSLTQAMEATGDPELRGKAQYLLGETHARGGSWHDAAGVLGGLDPLSALAGRAAQGAAHIRANTPLPEKSPWTAGLLAAVLPGAGHAYLGRWRDAGLAFSMNAAFTAATLEAIQKDNPALAGTLALAELIWYSGNIFSAVGSAHKHNRQAQERLVEEIRAPSGWLEPPVSAGRGGRVGP